MPPHAAMIHKPLYHGCIDAHGAVPNPDGTLLATSGRGSSNIYLIDAVNCKVLGNVANSQAGPTTNPERLSSGIRAAQMIDVATIYQFGCAAE